MDGPHRAPFGTGSYAHGTRCISQHFSTMENENKKCLRAQTLMILSSSSVVTSWEQKVPEGINLHDLVFIQCCDIMRTKSAWGHKPSWFCLHPALCLYMMQMCTDKFAHGTKQTHTLVLAWAPKVPMGTNLHDLVFIHCCVYTWCRRIHINLHRAPNKTRIPAF